jgi:hypothetical protein
LTVIPIWCQYLSALSLVIITVFILGIVIFALYPSKKLKIAILWIAVGIMQITLWGLYAYPIVFNYFPSQTAFGIFLLTCGIFLYSLSQTETSNLKRILTILSLLFLGCVELFVFLNFYFSFPNTNQWNTMIDATSYIAFLVAAVSTFGCVIFVFLRSMNITLRSKISS